MSGIKSRIVIPFVVLPHLVEVEVGVANVTCEVLFLHLVVADDGIVFGITWIGDVDDFVVDAPFEIETQFGVRPFVVVVLLVTLAVGVEFLVGIELDDRVV